MQKQRLYCLKTPPILVLVAVFFAVSATQAWGFNSASKAKMRSSKGDNYLTFVEVGADYYKWDKPGAIAADDREFFMSSQPNGAFTSDVDDDGIGITLRVGGEANLGGSFQKKSKTSFWLGWWGELGTLPDFSTRESFSFQAQQGNQIENRRIDGDLDFDGSLTYGLGLTGRWEWGNKIKYSAGPFVNYNWYEIDGKTNGKLFIEDNGQFQQVDEFSESSNLDDSAFGYGLFVGATFGGENGRSPWYFRVSYSTSEVNEFDMDRIGLSLYKSLGAYRHHAEGP